MRKTAFLVLSASLVLAVMTGCQQTATDLKPDLKAGAKDSPEAPAKAKAVARPVRIAAGTVLEVRVGEALSTARNRVGDKFEATLDEPVTVEGQAVLARGARVEGHVTSSSSSGRLEGRAMIGITLDSVEHQGKKVPLVTTLDTKTGEAHKKRNIELIGGGAGVGALIGGIVGGGKGAAIGAGAGAAAGAGTAAATGKKDIEIPAETVFAFKLRSAVDLP